MRIVKIIAAVLGGILFCVTVYYAAEAARARRNTPRIVYGALHSGRVRLRVQDLSAWQLKALLAVEDPNFYRHRGIDMKTPGAGLTTITQSLAKIFYFNRFKPGIAKLKQSVIARSAVDAMVSKDDQLTLFVNYIYLGSVRGRPVYGFADAAEAYYGKPFAALSENEYLSLVAMIIAPANFNILTRPQANAERTARIRKVVSGEYRPKHLMDLYYGKLDSDTVKGLAPSSYFPALYTR